MAIQNEGQISAQGTTYHHFLKITILRVSLRVTKVFHSIVDIKLVQECVLPPQKHDALHLEIWSHVKTNDRTHIPRG